MIRKIFGFLVLVPYFAWNIYLWKEYYSKMMSLWLFIFVNVVFFLFWTIRAILDKRTDKRGLQLKKAQGFCFFVILIIYFVFTPPGGANTFLFFFELAFWYGLIGFVFYKLVFTRPDDFGLAS